jgi:hypothetical protein
MLLMMLMGVRMSWLMRERNSVLAGWPAPPGSTASCVRLQDPALLLAHTPPVMSLWTSRISLRSSLSQL